MSLNFKREEFECKCGCGFGVLDEELLVVLENVRTKFGNKPITITSGCRCAKHNKDVGGADASKHIFGIAADFKIQDVHEDEVADYLESIYQNSYGIGRYVGRTHIDIRAEKRRWDNR